MSFKFTSINQFRNLVQNIKHQAQYLGQDTDNNAMMDRNKRLPKIVFLATPKIHGSNAGVRYFPKTGLIQYLSRERILSLEQDNANFMLNMKEKEQRGVIKQMMETLLNAHKNQFEKEAESIVLYGEWAGGSIQKGVAVSGLPVFFAPFAIKFMFGEEDEAYVPVGMQQLPFLIEERIYPVNVFGYWKIEIDFELPAVASNKLVEICMQVEDECPVGKYFGRVKGTDLTTGEGIVIRPLGFSHSENEAYYPYIKFDDYGNSCKVKGEKHAVSKVKTLAAVDVEAIQSMNKFIEYAVTENRMEQMFQKLINEQQQPFAMESMGEFLRLLISDIYKEEQDTIIGNCLDQKKLGSAVANTARKWYMDKYNSQDL